MVKIYLLQVILMALNITKIHENLLLKLIYQNEILIQQVVAPTLLRSRLK